MVRPVDATRAARRRKGAPRGRALEPLLWIAPALAAIAFVFGYALYRLVIEATHRDGVGVGLDNLRIVWSDPPFRTAIGHNLRLLVTLPVISGIALLLAVLLFEGLRGWKLHRVALFIPYLLPVPVVGVLFGQFLTLHGQLNSLLDALGLHALALDWLGNPDLALRSLAGVIIWKELGFGVILFLARLLSLSTDPYDAARVDGAGWWRLHWHISLPQLRSIIGFYFVIEGVTLFAWVFNYVYVMTRGGPGDATQVAETYIYDNATTANLPWLAASGAVVLLGGFIALAAVALLVRFALTRRGSAA